MRILEITGEPILHGGQENFIYNVLENINNDDIQFDVLTPYICDNERFKQLVKTKHGKVYELNLAFRPWKSRRLLYKPVKEFLRSQKYDVIHIHSGSISVLAYEALAAKKAGIKKIIVHSHSTGKKGFKHSLIYTVFYPILKTCPTYYMACSKEAGEMKFPRGVQDEVVVIKNGINLERFKRNKYVGRELRKKFDISNNTFVIGHVGRFSPEKNHAFLIDVFKKLHEQVPDSKLFLVGEGELLDQIKAKVVSLGLEKNVIFLGVVDNPQDYYNIMDCFILPSIYEGFSFVTLEAQANGLPCVVSTGVPDAVVLTNNVNRLELDIGIWAERILSLKDNGIADDIEILRENGYDISSSAALIERIYL